MLALHSTLSLLVLALSAAASRAHRLLATHSPFRGTATSDLLDSRGAIARLQQESFSRIVLATSPAMIWIIATGVALFASSAIQHPGAFDLGMLLFMALVIALQYVVLFLLYRFASTLKASWPSPSLLFVLACCQQHRRSAILHSLFRPPRFVLAIY